MSLLSFAEHAQNGFRPRATDTESSATWWWRGTAPFALLARKGERGIAASALAFATLHRGPRSAFAAGQPAGRAMAGRFPKAL